MDGPRRAIRLEAARHGLKAIAKLAALLDKKGVADAAVISAAIHLLDRGYGKPAQEVRYSGIVGNYNLEGLSDEELDQFIALARKASADVIGESD